MSDSQPLAGKRILVLEDDYYIATDEKALLARAGATVVRPFGRGCTGRDIAQAGEIDGAVVDINLGLGPTFEFARLLADQGTLYVFVTGYNEAAIPDELRAVPRLEKPIRERELITVLAGLLGDRTSGDAEHG